VRDWAISFISVQPISREAIMYRSQPTHCILIELQRRLSGTYRVDIWLPDARASFQTNPPSRIPRRLHPQTPSGQYAQW
jgi:hypothetical protein